MNFKPHVKLGGYLLVEGLLGFSSFELINERYVIRFTAEYKKGLYFKILNVEDRKVGRFYTSQRYFYKFTIEVREASFYLLVNDYLYSYNQSQPALLIYLRDIKPYIMKLKGLENYTLSSEENMIYRLIQKYNI